MNLFHIHGFTGKENRSIMLSHRDVSSKDMLLEADTIHDREDWEVALGAHIEHAIHVHKARKQFINIS